MLLKSPGMLQSESFCDPDLSVVAGATLLLLPVLLLLLPVLPFLFPGLVFFLVVFLLGVVAIAHAVQVDAAHVHRHRQQRKQEPELLVRQQTARGIEKNRFDSHNQLFTESLNDLCF